MNRITFITPPNWPDPPKGYLPEADWAPDPSWGPAPAGFQFYRDAFGYPTPPPPEYWQPWESTDWSAVDDLPAPQAATPDTATPAFPTSPAPVQPLPTRRRPRWLAWLVGLLLVGLLAGGGWFGWQHWKSKPPPAPADVADLTKLYEPALPVGGSSYQFAQEIPVQVFKGKTACIPKLNAALAPAKQAVAAGSERGWGAYTWRFTDAAAARKAWTELQARVVGCTADGYTLGAPQHSPDAEQRWTQYQQSAKDGTDHGRIVLTTDANTVTWLEGGQTEMGGNAFKAVRKRLTELG
ncbi:hypothetical protein AAEX63_12950 [Luteococcus sp. H138]|uniref:hypothetical protein n=1 Tax=unclassified Luteococcus TaxID=2639923 RepID=UPI00313E6053